MILATNTIANPGAVVIHAINAPLAQLAVMRSHGFYPITFEAVAHSLECFDFITTSSGDLQLHC